MLFDLGWSEILLVGVVALVFIGPKDLPKALRVAGFWVRKARNLSREFQSSIDQMIRESELDEMRQDLKKASEFDLEQEFHNTIEPPAGPMALPPAEPAGLVGSEQVAAPAIAPDLDAAAIREAAEAAEHPAPAAGSAEPAAGAASPGPGQPSAGLARDSAPPRP
jgi:sec-independent protein translocase protein TatB